MRVTSTNSKLYMQSTPIILDMRAPINKNISSLTIIYAIHTPGKGYEGTNTPILNNK